MGRLYYLEKDGVSVKRIKADGKSLEDALMWSLISKQELSNYSGKVVFEGQMMPSSWFLVATFSSEKDAESWKNASQKGACSVRLSDVPNVKILMMDADETEKRSYSSLLEFSLPKYGGMKQSIRIEDKEAYLLMFAGVSQMNAWGKFAGVEGA